MNVRTRLLPTLDYYNSPGVRELQHALKAGSDAAAYQMALEMARYVPDDAVLVPIPGRRGYGGAGLTLAKKLEALTGHPVADVLRGRPHPSLYLLKRHGIDPRRVDLGFYQVGPLPAGTPVLVDNVVGTGHTALCALQVIPDALVLVHAVDFGALRVRLQPPSPPVDFKHRKGGVR